MSILKNKMSLRLRIFISMILLVFTATLLVLGSTYYQYRTESEQYNTYRQDRKETQLTKQINYIASKFDLTNNYEKWENYIATRIKNILIMERPNTFLQNINQQLCL